MAVSGDMVSKAPEEVKSGKLAPTVPIKPFPCSALEEMKNSTSLQRFWQSICGCDTAARGAKSSPTVSNGTIGNEGVSKSDRYSLSSGALTLAHQHFFELGFEVFLKIAIVRIEHVTMIVPKVLETVWFAVGQKCGKQMCGQL